LLEDTLGPVLFIGVDLGGSGTRAVLADAHGHVLAIGRGPTGLLGGSGAAARRYLARALEAVLAPIAPQVQGVPCMVFAGTRGLSIPGRRDQLILQLRARLPSAADVRVANDALIGLWGGLAGSEGAAVVAGAGSIAFARTADGREGRAGGWGYLLGDEGSAYWLGREALAHFLRALETRADFDSLCKAVAGTLGRSTPSDVLTWYYAGQNQVTRLADLAPLVSRAAEAGDTCAQLILARGGRALAEQASAAARQVWPESLPETLPVACSGGVWSAGACLQDAFDAALAEHLPGARRTPPRLPPVGGAVLLALGADRTPPTPEVIPGLVEGLRRF
jgi:glucosamine kinase